MMAHLCSVQLLCTPHLIAVEPEDGTLGFFFLEELKEQKELRYQVGLRVPKRVHLPPPALDPVLTSSSQSLYCYRI